MELVKSAELVEAIFNYKGTLVKAAIKWDKDCYGNFFVVHLNGKYVYTLYHGEKKWLVVNQCDNSLPLVEEGFLEMLTAHLSWEFNHTEKLNT